MGKSSSVSFKGAFSIVLIWTGLLLLLAPLLRGTKLTSSLEGTLLDMDLRKIAFVANSPLHSTPANRRATYVSVATKENISGEVDFVGREHIEVEGLRFEVTNRTVFKGFNSLTDLSEGKEVEVEFSRQESKYTASQIALGSEDMFS